MAKKLSTIAERLREALVAARMKQIDLARASGLDRGAISNYLAGRYIPKFDAASRMADVLGCDVYWLIGFNNTEKSEETTMAKEFGLTDAQVEEEIEKLNASEAVALARREARLRYKRRQYLYQLRDLEKKGKALLAAGITREVLDAMYQNGNEDELSRIL